jgi:hypothetical protein
MHDDKNLMFLDFATILEPTLIDYDCLLSTADRLLSTIGICQLLSSESVMIRI